MKPALQETDVQVQKPINYRRMAGGFVGAAGAVFGTGLDISGVNLIQTQR